tara:strand:- start:6 stop:383 length:378 start_codon:yes stop_codon:yes gene_type:complete
MKMRNGKTAKSKTKKMMTGMKTASGSSRAGESGRKRPMVPTAGKPMQAKPKKPMKKKNSGIAPAMPSGGGPLGMQAGTKTKAKTKKMMNGMKTGVGKKKFEMRGMMDGGKVENFQDYVKRVFGGS